LVGDGPFEERERVFEASFGLGMQRRDWNWELVAEGMKELREE
jgi:hypothetical protein